jgi:hypothetical protein
MMYVPWLLALSVVVGGIVGTSIAVVGIKVANVISKRYG